MGTPEQTKGPSSLALHLLRWPVPDLWRGRKDKAKVNLQQYFPLMLPSPSEMCSSDTSCFRSGVSITGSTSLWGGRIELSPWAVQDTATMLLPCLCLQLMVLRAWQEGTILVFFLSFSAHVKDGFNLALNTFPFVVRQNSVGSFAAAEGTPCLWGWLGKIPLF